MVQAAFDIYVVEKQLALDATASEAGSATHIYRSVGSDGNTQFIKVPQDSAPKCEKGH